jgi:hypothetical protein
VAKTNYLKQPLDDFRARDALSQTPLAPANALSQTLASLFEDYVATNRVIVVDWLPWLL